MGIMGFLRERMGKILAIVIGLALFAFVIGEVVRSGSSFFRDSRTDVGEVAGEKIPYAAFSDQLAASTKNFEQQSGKISPQISNYLQENTWNMMISQAIIKKEIDKLGLTLGDVESTDMVSGNNPDQQIVRQFTDPQTGQFDPSKVEGFKSYINSPKADPAQKKQWNDFLTQLFEAKLTQKYLALVNNGLYVNSLEAKDSYEAKNKLANFKYMVLDYASVPDSKITITDDDYSAYYNEHKTEFKNPQELRSFDYVSFDGSPSKEDSLDIKSQVEKLVPDFKASTNDSLFVQIQAETKAPLVFQHKGQLEPKLDSVMFSAAKGFIYGPYLSNGSYKIAKLVDAVVGPDSVKASHILISPAVVGGQEKALAMADSLKKLVQSGKSFAELAKTFSTDKGSAEKGGELPTFGRGAMIAPFEDAVFNGKKGDLKIVTTQFGVHLILVGDQKGSSKVIKVAIVDKPLVSSDKTQKAAYSKAQGFLGKLTKDNFESEALTEHLQKKTANDVNGIAASVPGIDNARDIVRWAFKSDIGTFSDEVFTVGDKYIIAKVTGIKPEGTLALDAVKKQIEPMVKNKVKAKLLIDKLQSALNGATTIEQAAQKASTKVIPIENIVFANPVIPGFSTEYAVIGSVFGSQVNKLSKPVEGQAGVFVFAVNSFTNPAPLTNTLREKQQLGQALQQRANNQVFEALKDKANVKDYRAKFL